MVTNADHEANVTPWLRLAEERGATVRVWPADPATAGLDLAGLAPLMTGRTRLVCFPHVSNVRGNGHPVAEIARFVHQRGALVCVDGVAYAPHRAVDVRAWTSVSTSSASTRSRPSPGAALRPAGAAARPRQRRSAVFRAQGRPALSSPAISITSWRTACRRSSVPGGAGRRRDVYGCPASQRIEAASAAIALHEESLAAHSEVPRRQARHPPPGRPAAGRRPHPPPSPSRSRGRSSAGSRPRWTPFRHRHSLRRFPPAG